MSNPEFPRQTNPPPLPSQPLLRRFFQDIFYLPRLHKTLLGLAVVMVGYGWIHLGYHTATEAAGTTSATRTSSSLDKANAPPDNATSIFFAKLARRVGGSVLIGFVIGWIFRTFLGIMTIITTLILGVFAALSYFSVMNIDMTSAEKKYQTASEWITDQAGKIRHSAMSHVHSTAGGALGAFLGFRKRRFIIARTLLNHG